MRGFFAGSLAGLAVVLLLVANGPGPAAVVDPRLTPRAVSELPGPDSDGEAPAASEPQQDEVAAVLIVIEVPYEDVDAILEGGPDPRMGALRPAVQEGRVIGLELHDIELDSPAIHLFRLREGDVVTALNGSPVEPLGALLGALSAASTYTLDIIRQGAPIQIRYVGEGQIRGALGSLADGSILPAKSPRRTSGEVRLALRTSSPAYSVLGLRAGDLLLSWNGGEITPADLRDGTWGRAVMAWDGPIQVRLRRRGVERTLTWEARDKQP